MCFHEKEFFFSNSETKKNFISYEYVVIPFIYLLFEFHYFRIFYSHGFHEAISNSFDCLHIRRYFFHLLVLFNQLTIK